jgi:hypothetical protein
MPDLTDRQIEELRRFVNEQMAAHPPVAPDATNFCAVYKAVIRPILLILLLLLPQYSLAINAAIRLLDSQCP